MQDRWHEGMRNSIASLIWASFSIFFWDKNDNSTGYASIRFEVSDIFNILLQAYMLIYSSPLEGRATSDYVHITLKEQHWIFQVLFAWVDYNKQLARPSQIQVQIVDIKYQSLKRTSWLFVISNRSFVLTLEAILLLLSAADGCERDSSWYLKAWGSFRWFWKTICAAHQVRRATATVICLKWTWLEMQNRENKRNTLKMKAAGPGRASLPGGVGSARCRHEARPSSSVSFMGTSNAASGTEGEALPGDPKSDKHSLLWQRLIKLLKQNPFGPRCPNISAYRCVSQRRAAASWREADGRSSRKETNLRFTEATVLESYLCRRLR